MMTTDNPWSVTHISCVLRPVEEVCFCTMMSTSGMASKVTAQQRIHLSRPVVTPSCIVSAGNHNCLMQKRQQVTDLMLSCQVGIGIITLFIALCLL